MAWPELESLLQHKTTVITLSLLSGYGLRQKGGSVSAMLRQCGVRAFWVAVVALGLAACAIVDEYSGRAIVYNLQAEQAQQQALLLNVVRASLRRPMQFTGLQTITGTASASGSVAAGATAASQTPYISMFNLIPANSSSLVSRALTGNLGGTASMSGGPTFTVPVLDTQEFYEGLLTPIPGQLLDLYLQAGYPRDVMFNLVIERIIIKKTGPGCPLDVHTPNCELTIRNYPPQDVDLELFQGMLGYLISLGLTTEPIIEPPAKQKPAASGASAQADAGPKLKPFTFCFAPRDARVYKFFNRGVLCGHPAAGLLLKPSEIGRKSVISGVPIFQEFADRLYDETIKPRLGTDLGADGFRSILSFGGQKVSISFNTRSIEEILYYLGEVGRRSLHPETEREPRRVQVRVGPPQNQFPDRPCPFEGPINGYVCKDLFVLEEDSATEGGIAVKYEGTRYSISPDPNIAWSMPVLDIVKQLLAVNTSAKQLPASNLISVLSN